MTLNNDKRSHVTQVTEQVWTSLLQSRTYTVFSTALATHRLYSPINDPSSMNLAGSGPGSPYSPRLPTLSSDLAILSNDGVSVWCIDMLLLTYKKQKITKNSHKTLSALSGYNNMLMYRPIAKRGKSGRTTPLGAKRLLFNPIQYSFIKQMTKHT